MQLLFLCHDIRQTRDITAFVGNSLKTGLWHSCNEVLKGDFKVSLFTVLTHLSISQQHNWV